MSLDTICSAMLVSHIMHGPYYTHFIKLGAKITVGEVLSVEFGGRFSHLQSQDRGGSAGATALHFKFTVYLGRGGGYKWYHKYFSELWECQKNYYYTFNEGSFLVFRSCPGAEFVKKKKKSFCYNATDLHDISFWGQGGALRQFRSILYLKLSELGRDIYMKTVMWVSWMALLYIFTAIWMLRYLNNKDIKLVLPPHSLSRVMHFPSLFYPFTLCIFCL